MTTKLITSLDELEPGMKTKDGRFEYTGMTFRGCPVVVDHGLESENGYELKHGGLNVFLNQEVEVPE